MTPEIDADRLLGNLAELSNIGGRADGGIDRLAWSHADVQARRWLRDRLDEIGWRTEMDAAFNVFGRASDERRLRLLIGSHTDSVAAGGRLDGSYGVVAALEVARVLATAHDPAEHSIEIVDFADEEGVRFPCGYFGSKALTGQLDVDALRLARGDDGTAEEIVRAAGVELSDAPSAAGHLDDVAGYLELHIEQGPVLEHAGAQIGVATGIFGFDRYLIEIVGSSTHGGTAPFELRADPVRTAAQLIAGLQEVVQGVDRSGRATVGSITSKDGAINFVADRVKLSVELRQPSIHKLQRTVQGVAALLRAACDANGCRATFERQHQAAETRDGIALAIEPAFLAPVVFDSTLADCCERACASLGARHQTLTAGTWHDAGIIAQKRPAAMLLVPSLGGFTHSPREMTLERDLVVGAQALLEATRCAVRALGLS